jgi:autotransporter-associated beta strand protein
MKLRCNASPPNNTKPMKNIYRLATLFTLASPTLSAADFFWEGGYTNGSWAQAPNWNPATVPTFNNTADIKFTSVPTTQFTNFINADRTIRSLEFNSSSATGIDVRLSNAIDAGARTLTFDAGGGTSSIVLGSSSGAAVTLAASGSFLGDINIANNLVVTNNSTRLFTIGRPIIETGVGGYRFTKNGTGSMRFQSAAARNFTGGLFIENGEIGMFNASDSINSANVVTFGDSVGGTSGSWNLSANSVASTHNVAAIATVGGTSNTIRASNAGSTLTLSGATGTHDFAGAIENVISIVKSGDNTQKFSGTNTYTGTTAVNAGTLLINGSTSTSSAVTVATGATLGGTGTVGGTLTVNSGGSFAPGDGGIESLNITSTLALAAGSFSLFEINTAGNAADLAAAAAAIAFGGTLNVSNIGAALVDGDIFNLFDFASASSSGTFSTVNLPSLTSGLGWNQTNLYSDGTIAVVAIPEPSTALLGALGALALLRRRR